MASTKQSSLNNSSSSWGSSYAPRQASVSVMASCYLIDNSATLVKGFHYCTTTLTGTLTIRITQIDTTRH